MIYNDGHTKPMYATLNISIDMFSNIHKTSLSKQILLQLIWYPSMIVGKNDAAIQMFQVF